jgi:hypothetical protein
VVFDLITQSADPEFNFAGDYISTLELPLKILKNVDNKKYLVPQVDY